MREFNGKGFTLYQGSMLDMGERIKSNSIDSIVTDPPYELNFMGKGWDNSGIAFQADTWKRCLDVLKPGGYLLAFGGSRTFHRIAVAIEDAGFEIRDIIMWLYGSGFPKSLNLGKSVESKLVNGSANTQAFKDLQGTKQTMSWGMNKRNLDYGCRPADYSADGHGIITDVDYQTEEGQKWDGWGTALKPSYEPIIVARKPCEGSCTDNVIKYGVGGINIDECRVGNEFIKGGTMAKMNSRSDGINLYNFGKKDAERLEREGSIGRFPANTILTYDDADFDEVCGGFPNTKSNGGNITHKDFSKHKGSMMHNTTLTEGAGRYENGYIAPSDSGSAARYFYCAKASKRDRDEGLDDFESKQKVFNGQSSSSSTDMKDVEKRFTTTLKNTHPTVKPTSLMQYLVRLVTPKGGTVLDPFNGSGSTGKAVMYENKDRGADYKYIGIELTEEYIPIAIARIEYVVGAGEPENIPDTDGIQMTIFDYLKGEA